MRVRNGQLLRRSHLDFLQIANLDKDTDKLEENELITKKNIRINPHDFNTVWAPS